MSFDESIKKIELVLSCNGLTIRSRYNDVRTRWKNRFLFIFNMIWFNSEAICGVAWMVLRLNEGGTIAEVTYMAPCALFTLLSVLKALLFIYYEDNICDLVASLRKLDIKYNNKSISSEDIDFLHFTLKLSKILNAMLCVVFSWSTLVVSCIFYIKDGVFDVIFPLKVEYPFSFDHNNARLWPFVYIHQFWSVCLVIFIIIGTDYLLYVCCTYIKVQYRLLAEHFQRTINENCHSRENSFDESCIPLIKWHQSLIELVDNLEFVYTRSFLCNFLSSSMLICLTGFNVVSMKNAEVTFMFLVFLSCNLAQIFLLCYFGDLVMKSSMEVGSSIYNSRWYKMDAKSVKSLLIIHLRSLKPCKLTAFGFFDVNLKSFMSIMSTSWSYFALLKTVATPTKT